MKKVFVYGTLLRGMRNHVELQSSAFLGAAKTRPEFTMISCGTFPAILAKGETSIVGELFDVGHSVLMRLDRLEGHPNFYKRTLITVRQHNRELEAFAYVLASTPESARVIASGSWVEHATR